MDLFCFASKVRKPSFFSREEVANFFYRGAWTYNQPLPSIYSIANYVMADTSFTSFAYKLNGSVQLNSKTSLSFTSAKVSFSISDIGLNLRIQDIATDEDTTRYNGKGLLKHYFIEKFPQVNLRLMGFPLNLLLKHVAFWRLFDVLKSLGRLLHT